MAVQRTEKGRFAPGQTGNPGGRPKTPAHIREMLDKLTPRAVEIMAKTLNSDDEKLRFQAAQEVLNRSLGKPHLSATLDVRNNSAAAHIAALQSLAAGVSLNPAPTIEHHHADIVDVEPIPIEVDADPADK